VQHAIAVALGDYAHVAAEKEVYRKRREVLLPAVRDFGFELSDSEAGLYLWATLHEDCWVTVERMAALGILVGPGSLYGSSSQNHIRFALTATDENIAEAATRLRNAIGLNNR
jgi:aspartate/methionine/tyrosine aminotransferase